MDKGIAIYLTDLCPGYNGHRNCLGIVRDPMVDGSYYWTVCGCECHGANGGTLERLQPRPQDSDFLQRATPRPSTNPAAEMPLLTDVMPCTRHPDADYRMVDGKPVCSKCGRPVQI